MNSLEFGPHQNAGTPWRDRGRASLAAAVAIAAVVFAQHSRAAERILTLADGRQLQFTEYGDPGGRLVLFFHGTPGSCRDAAVVEDNMRAGRIRLITPSRPGLGRSTYQPGRAILDWPSDVDQLVTAVAGPGAHFSILAMSGGTPYALATARAFPNRVEQVVIASGYAPPEAKVPATKVARTLDFVERRPRIARAGIDVLGRIMDRRPEAALAHVSKSWSEGDRRLVECRPDLKREVIATLREATRCGPAGVTRDAQLLGSCWGFNVRDVPAVPISIYHGCDDAVAPVQMAHWLHRQLPQSQLTVYVGAGHLSTLIWHTDAILGDFVESSGGTQIRVEKAGGDVVDAPPSPSPL
ncbi:MAG: alpha/beta hydrolase [Planctomycetales bacterium]|nr:alpha/beta hydrolase [Planctomycetales bacterium]